MPSSCDSRQRVPCSDVKSTHFKLISLYVVPLPLLITEVVTPSGKGYPHGMPVATGIRSRVQLFVDHGTDYGGLCVAV